MVTVEQELFGDYYDNNDCDNNDCHNNINNDDLITV
jgi:hypothetical protein